MLTRASSHPELFADTAALNGILSDWHASIGKAILENWEFSEDMCAAIGYQDDHNRDEPVAPDLRDVIAVAIVMAAYHTSPEGIDLALGGLPTVLRFGLDPEKTRILMQESAAEVAALSSALGD